jgi:hypothetical protein
MLGEARAEAVRKHMEYLELSGRKDFQETVQRQDAVFGRSGRKK